jgi:hypothetical protein
MTTEEIIEALAAPFNPEEVKWKPGKVSGNRALALAYVDARVIQDRLDNVVGVLGWSDEYEAVGNGTFLCRLKVRVGDEWITKMDVGGESEQADEGDRTKAAVSDALKRAAVKFGMGRYLYRFPHQWADFDSGTKKFVKTPTLPAFALPRAKPKPPSPELHAPTLRVLEVAAKGGMSTLEAAWNGLSKDERKVCEADLPRLKQEAGKYVATVQTTVI